MKKLEGVPALIICALLWSTGGILIKLVDYNSFAIAGCRSLVALVFLMCALRRPPHFVIRKPSNAAPSADTDTEAESRKRATVDGKATLYLWLAAITYALTMTFYVLGNKLTTAANTILLEYTGPLYIIMFGPAILGEKNRKSDYFTAAGVMAGMILFFSDGLSAGNQLGNFLAALSGVTFGFSTIFMRKLKSYESETAFMLAHLINAVLWLPFAVMAGYPSLTSVTGLVLLGIFQMGIPSILYSLGLNKVPALTGSFISMIEPLMNPIWVLLATGERPSMLAIAGGVLIIGAVTVRGAIQK